MCESAKERKRTNQHPVVSIKSKQAVHLTTTKYKKIFYFVVVRCPKIFVPSTFYTRHSTFYPRTPPFYPQNSTVDISLHSIAKTAGSGCLWSNASDTIQKNIAAWIISDTNEKLLSRNTDRNAALLLGLRLFRLLVPFMASH